MRVRALEVEQSVARVDAELKLVTTLVACAALGQAGLVLMLSPQTALSSEAALGVTRQAAGAALVKLTALAAAWRLPRLLLRLKRIKIGAFEPGQLKI